ncbi:GNAT family N-acetyltransferase [Alicyclobacillus fastidiosus]|uniref:GNAT family N-acetyltransferase n=1 Tax=Alicyclobacillus fastidiosus TaxID=392011 RepID=A0ABY6ZI09_9BACL|nr:GNAT family N-acetyltransferase [Alicyclobacillus fastidiosus]WAH42385.1 GNAT family N-acetyltransferase [Alicyclobacillus fastidiosus]
MTILETPRLLLRRWGERDIVPMSRINADPEVMRWIGGGATRTEDETKTFIERCEEMWETQGFGLFAVEMRDAGELAGFVGVSVPTFLPEVMPAVEIGWRLDRSFWGNGIATEAAKEALRFGFENCDLSKILSICQIGNGASERIMQKLGMYLNRETIDPSCGRRVRIYAIERQV